MTKKDLLEFIKKLIVVLLIFFLIFLGTYSTVLRFMYPELTETQLFLKVFGLC